MESTTMTLEEALAKLHTVSPTAPFLALGQTVFWDEPMKAGVALKSRRLGYERRLVAGVHDTDYFAKLPSGASKPGKFLSLPHNDTTTRGLWSAAGEFSTLFGSETVISREALIQAGLRIELLKSARPDFLDEATEAWGWRGIVSLDSRATVTAELPARQVMHELKRTFDWALDSTLECLTGQGRQLAESLADELRTMLCDESEADPSQSLSELYRRLLPRFYSFCAQANISVDTTATTELLKFNTATASLPRFELLDLFLRPESKDVACQAYNGAIQRSGLYGLDRFGTGAIPFDLVIPGVGRGTLRIGNRGIVIGSTHPQFISLKRPIRSAQELAAAIETKFGPDCVLVGKAVTLIGMLAREFVFVFHEGASSYVVHSRAMHQTLAQNGFPLELNPILRVKYSAWDAMQVSCSWLKMPEPFQQAFGTEELCAPSFAARWKQVAEEQEALLADLSKLRRPTELIQFLDERLGGSWHCLATEYGQLHGALEGAAQQVDELRNERRALYGEIRSLRQERLDREREKGEHFRAKIFEKEPSEEDLRERERLSKAVDDTIGRLTAAKKRVLELMHAQREVVQSEEVQKIHDRRRAIELEAELKRMRLVRNAIISSKGLKRANFRPSAWWFPLVCPDGLWFRETVETAECYLEALT